jgi:5-carboxymethyl-2-hydroxymuconate isomerase
MKTIRLHASQDLLPVGKIVCLGRNYAEHAKEMQSGIPTTPILFLKPSSALIYNGEPILLPKVSNHVHYEVELVVAIGKGGKNIPRAEAYSHVLGYAIGLDITLRDVQDAAKKSGLPWSVAKGFDTSAPISDIVPAARIQDPHALTIACTVNGIVRQKSSTGEMIFSIDAIIEYISSIFTLESGDLIFTGTPSGVGEIKPGDTIEAEMVGYERITHPVRSA